MIGRSSIYEKNLARAKIELNQKQKQHSNKHVAWAPFSSIVVLLTLGKCFGVSPDIIDHKNLDSKSGI